VYLFHIGACDSHRDILGMGLDSTGVFVTGRDRPQSVTVLASGSDC
jgi:hypothetical protein